MKNVEAENLKKPELKTYSKKLTFVDPNATQTAIRAGYKVDNAQQVGSENLSKLNIEQGNRLLANVSVKSYIEQQLKNLNPLRF